MKPKFKQQQAHISNALVFLFNMKFFTSVKKLLCNIRDYIVHVSLTLLKLYARGHLVHYFFIHFFVKKNGNVEIYPRIYFTDSEQKT